MNKVATDLKEGIAQNVDRMRTLRDEIRLKLHLAGLDAKSEWEKLEPKVLEAEQAAEKVTQASYDILADAVKKLNALLLSIE